MLTAQPSTYDMFALIELFGRKVQSVCGPVMKLTPVLCLNPTPFMPYNVFRPWNLELPKWGFPPPNVRFKQSISLILLFLSFDQYIYDNVIKWTIASMLEGLLNRTIFYHSCLTIPFQFPCPCFSVQSPHLAVFQLLHLLQERLFTRRKLLQQKILPWLS